MSKQEMRKELAALSFTEKVKILEKLRDRSLAIAAGGLIGTPPPVKIYCEHGAWTNKIKELRRSGRVAVLHFAYDSSSRAYKAKVAAASQARICDLNLRINELPCCIDDYTESSRFWEILSTVGEANRRDALQVDSAFKAGCVAFVTPDSHILDRKTELERLLGVRFFHPSEDRNLELFIAGLL